MRRVAALALGLLLLCGCTPGGAPPAQTPEPVAAAEAVTWLHGFYASASYGQIGLTDDMEAVSLGWARLRLDERGPWVSTTGENGNLWVTPQGAELATGYFQERELPYNLCVFTSTANRTTLADGTQTDVLSAAISETYREETARALAEAAEGYSGLTVDFEGLASAERRADFSAFMEALRRALPADKLLYVAVPPDDWYQGYDYRALGETCDRVILMAHDYQWQRAPEANLGTGKTDTPVAPIGRVEAALRDITHRETGVEDVSKVALAISFSAAGVKVDEEGNLLETQVYAPGPKTLSQRLAQPDAQPGWSDQYASPYVYYHDDSGARYRVWYEDARSVEAKIRLALAYGVPGVSIWRLGAIPTYENYDVWTTILEEKTP